MDFQQTYEAQPVQRVQHQDRAQRAVEHKSHGLGERKAARIGANRDPLGWGEGDKRGAGREMGVVIPRKGSECLFSVPPAVNCAYEGEKHQDGGRSGSRKDQRDNGRGTGLRLAEGVLWGRVSGSEPFVHSLGRHGLSKCHEQAHLELGLGSVEARGLSRRHVLVELDAHSTQLPLDGRRHRDIANDERL